MLGFFSLMNQIVIKSSAGTRTEVLNPREFFLYLGSLPYSRSPLYVVFHLFPDSRSCVSRVFPISKQDVFCIKVSFCIQVFLCIQVSLCIQVFLCIPGLSVSRISSVTRFPFVSRFFLCIQVLLFIQVLFSLSYVSRFFFVSRFPLYPGPVEDWTKYEITKKL